MLRQPKKIAIKAAAWAMLSVSVTLAGQQAAGTWQNTTPSEAVGLYVNTLVQDPARLSDCYFIVDRLGLYKSSDYGQSWVHISTGTNNDKIHTGGWYTAIDSDPNRPATKPATIYATSGYGAQGIWKSTDGGVNWVDVWNNNIYAPDGVTKIYSDVGRDIAAVCMAGTSGPNHLIVSLHSYAGTGGNNGVFETFDGGGRWIVHKSATFNFQTHSDYLGALDSANWIVSSGQASPGVYVYHTGNAGTSWGSSGGDIKSGIGARTCQVDSTFYSGSMYFGGVYKTTDRGATWKNTGCPGSRVSWVVATATRLYAADGFDFDANPKIWQASLSNDAVWTSETMTSMSGSGEVAKTTFDGTCHIIIAAQHTAGVWRYVEPVSTTIANASAAATINAGRPGQAQMAFIADGQRSLLQGMAQQANTPAIYNVKGEQISANRIARQAVVVRNSSEH